MTEEDAARRRLMRIEGLDGGVEEGRVAEFGAVAWVLASNGEQAGGKRFVPFHGERGDIADDADKGVDGDVAGKRNGVEAGAAHRGVAQEGVERDGAGIPALGEDGVFENGEHDAGIAGTAEANFFQRGCNGGDSGEGSAGAEGLFREAFDGG